MTHPFVVVPEDEPEPEEEFEPATGDELKADRVVRSLAKTRSHIEHCTEQHRMMVERYDTWLARQLEPLKDREAYLEGQLGAWALARIEREPKGPKSFDLPSGTVRTRAGTTSVEVEDEKAFVDWAFENDRLDLLREPQPQPHRIDKTAVKQAIGNGLGTHPRLEGGEGLVTMDGEQVPGVHIVDKPRSVTVEVLGS